MKSIIKELYLGNTATLESIKASKEYFRLIGEIVDISDILEKDFTDEQKTQFRKLLELSAGLELEQVCTHFAEGFKLGLNIGIEASGAFVQNISCND